MTWSKILIILLLSILCGTVGVRSTAYAIEDIEVPPSSTASQSNSPSINKQYDYVDSYIISGLKRVRQANRWGFIDKDGTEVIPLIYSSVEPMFQGVSAASRDGKWGFINTEGKEVIPFIYDGAKRMMNEMAPVKVGLNWGYIGTDGQQRLPFMYQDAKAFSNGLAAVKQQGKWGFIDVSGRMDIACIFENVKDFNSELAAVQMGGRWGYINKAGNVVIAYQFEEASPFVAEWAPAKMGGKWGFIDRKGQVLVSYQYDRVIRWGGSSATVKLGNQEQNIIRPVPVIEPTLKDPDSPIQISPRNGSVFDHFPRATTLEWQSVKDIAYYVVEVDINYPIDSMGNRAWATERGQSAWLKRNTESTKISFNFAGAQSGRWRVWAIANDGRESAKSPWWYFTYKR